MSEVLLFVILVIVILCLGWAAVAAFIGWCIMICVAGALGFWGAVFPFGAVGAIAFVVLFGGPNASNRK